jgi:hypothetical protein
MSEPKKGHTSSEEVELVFKIKLLGGVLRLIGDEIPYCDPLRGAESLRKFGATVESLARELESPTENS